MIQKQQGCAMVRITLLGGWVAWMSCCVIDLSAAATVETNLADIAVVAQDEKKTQEKTEKEKADDDQSSADKDSAEEPSHPKWRDELMRRMDVDQEAREALVDLMKKSGGQLQFTDPEASKIIGKVQQVDKENREWLKEQIDSLGWPGKSKVGEKAAHAAWLLVQHADQDLEFQKACLEKMKQLAKDEVAAKDIAYLTDRVLNAEGKPQVYGTQVTQVDGEFAVGEVIEPEQLNKRRADVGLPPIEEYLETIKEAYGSPNKDDKETDDKKVDDKESKSSSASSSDNRGE